MPPITVTSRTAISVLAAKLSDLITNSIIEGCASAYGLPAVGTNKVDRLRSMFEAAETQKGRRNLGGITLTVLVMEAHARALSGKHSFDQATLETLLTQARVLAWDVAELSKKGWRAGITPSPAVAPAHIAQSVVSQALTPMPPTRHEAALDEMGRLSVAPTVSPQERGHRLEMIALGVLKAEKLRADRNVKVQGEELDLTFELSGVHYIVECKWLSGPVGDHDLSRLAHKVRTRAVGVRGVFLSMNGYVQDIETLAERGGQQHCIGFHAQHWMSVLEGRKTWTELVLGGWRAASINRKFIAPL